jgi:regulator of RNase E activity RraA
MTSIDELGSLTTPALADACRRVGVEVRTAPEGLRQLIPGTRAAGEVLPVRHAGSVDVFFEAYERSRGGEVMVIDNGGRTDEGCIGDLTVIEAREAGLKGVVVWGHHRDTDELLALGLPVFTYGRMRAVFVPLARLEELVAAGQAIMNRERAQAAQAEGGKSLREQMRFAEFLSRRERDPSYTFR